MCLAWGMGCEPHDWHGALGVKFVSAMRSVKKFQSFADPIFVLEMYDIYPLALYPKMGTFGTGRQCYNMS